MATTTASHFDLRALERLQERLQLDWAELAAVIGVDQSTLYRWRRGQASPRPMALSRLAQLGDLMQMLPRLFAGPDLAREWLRDSHPEMLDGRTPLEVMLDGRVDRVLMLLHFLARGA